MSTFKYDVRWSGKEWRKQCGVEGEYLLGIYDFLSLEDLISKDLWIGLFHLFATDCDWDQISASGHNKQNVRDRLEQITSRARMNLVSWQSAVTADASTPFELDASAVFIVDTFPTRVRTPPYDSDPMALYTTLWQPKYKSHVYKTQLITTLDGHIADVQTKIPGVLCFFLLFVYCRMCA